MGPVGFRSFSNLLPEANPNNIYHSPPLSALHTMKTEAPMDSKYKPDFTLRTFKRQPFESLSNNVEPRCCMRRWARVKP